MSTRTDAQVRVVANLLMAMFVAGLVLYTHGVVDDSDWMTIVGIFAVAVAFGAVVNIAAARR